VLDGFLGGSQSNTKLKENPFLPSYWYVLKLTERSSYITLYHLMKIGYISLNQRQEDKPHNGIILSLPRRKIHSYVSGKGHHYCLMGLSRNDFSGCDAKSGENQLQGQDQDTDRTQEVSKQIKLTEIQHKSCFSMTMQGQTQA
jgi:hypothetical protein